MGIVKLDVIASASAGMGKRPLYLPACDGGLWHLLLEEGR